MVEIYDKHFNKIKLFWAFNAKNNKKNDKDIIKFIEQSLSYSVRIVFSFIVVLAMCGATVYTAIWISQK